MATFKSNVAANNTGVGPGLGPQPAVVTYSDGVLIQIAYQNYYTNFWGSFAYLPPNGAVIGELYAVESYNYADRLLQSWSADNGVYSAGDVAYILGNGTAKQLAQYMFYLDDRIVGSRYADYLNGHRGNDDILGGKGPDKLWGGPGRDSFFFAKGDGKDAINDFSRSSDFLVLDARLADSPKEAMAAARTYNGGVVLDFGSDELKIAGLKKKYVDDLDYFFV